MTTRNAQDRRGDLSRGAGLLSDARRRLPLVNASHGFSRLSRKLAATVAAGEAAA